MRCSSLPFSMVRGALVLALAAVSAASCGTSSSQPPLSGTGGATTGTGGSSGTGGVSGTGGATGTGGTTDGTGGTVTAPVDAGSDAPTAADAPPSSDAPAPNTSTRALFYTYRTGYRHTSAVPASMVLRDKLMSIGFTADIVDADNNLFTDENLAKYRLVVMVQSSGAPVGMGTGELDALTKWLRNGGALAGFHAATDTGYPATHPYVALMGGKFVDHPGGIRATTCTPVAGATHPAVAKLTGPFMHTDEIYVYTGFNAANQVILNCANNTPGGPPVPITWYRMEGAGRLFYTGLGHVDSLWTANSTFVNNHYWPGILWALGR